jgi:Flp pilus assembly protein TadD
MSREALEKMLAKGMDNSLLRFGLGKACMDEGNLEQAAEHLQRCVGFDGKYSAAWKLLGQALNKLERHEEARGAWESGLAAAREKGDKQSEKEMTVFLKRLDKQAR